MADEGDHVSAKNPGGFWERPELVALHDEVLELIGQPVRSPLHSLPFPVGWWRSKEVQAVKRRMRAYVQSRLAETSGLWGFKDPRTCRLLPLWWEIFDELNLQPRYVWAIRPPVEAAASMAAKNPRGRPMSATQAEVIWMAYTFDVLRYALPSGLLAVDYNDWFDDPTDVARRLLEGLKLPGLPDQEELEECVRSIVQPQWRNQNAEGDRVAETPIAKELYRDLKQLSTGRWTAPGSGEKYADHLANLTMIFRNLTPFVELLLEVPDLREQVAQAQTSRDQAVSLEQEQRRRVEELEAKLKALSEQQVESLRSRLDEAQQAVKSTASESGRLHKENAELRRTIEKLNAARAAEAERMRSVLGQLAAPQQGAA